MIFWKYLKKYSRKYSWHFYGGLGALALTDIFDVIPPLIIMRGVDQITNKVETSELLKTALIFFSLTLALAFARYCWRMIYGHFHQNVAKELRNDVFDKLTRMGPTFYNKNQTGELMSLLTNDIEAVRMGMGAGIIVLADALFYFLTIPPIMFSLSKKLTFQTLILLPLLPFFVSWLGKLINKYFILEQEKFSQLSGFVQENISGQRTIKSFVQEKNQSVAFNKLSADLKNATSKVALAETFMHPVMEVCVSIGVVTLLYIGTQDVMSGVLTIGTFVAFHRYISKMTWPMTAIGWGFSLISQGAASLKRVDEFLNEPSDITEPTTDFMPEQTDIIIKNLSFKYPQSEQPALNKVSINIKKGEKIGIIGPVGSGKTTLAQLLTKLYPSERGSIFFGSTDINDLKLEKVRQIVTLVPQDNFLFSQSIRNNILYGASENLDIDKTISAAKTSQIHNEIESLPSHYESLIGERGINLSGGQKQRLAIARGLLRNSPVIIFDDAFSAVDNETERKIVENLFSQFENQTVIVISHKVQNLKFCDRIITLKEGSIVGDTVSN